MKNIITTIMLIGCLPVIVYVLVDVIRMSIKDLIRWFKGGKK